MGQCSYRGSMHCPTHTTFEYMASTDSEDGLIVVEFSSPVPLQHRYKLQLLMHLINCLNHQPIPFTLSLANTRTPSLALCFNYTLMNNILPRSSLPPPPSLQLSAFPEFNQVFETVLTLYSCILQMLEEHGIKESVFPKRDELIQKLEELQFYDLEPLISNIVEKVKQKIERQRIDVEQGIQEGIEDEDDEGSGLIALSGLSQLQKTEDIELEEERDDQATLLQGKTESSSARLSHQLGEQGLSHQLGEQGLSPLHLSEETDFI